MSIFQSSPAGLPIITQIHCYLEGRSNIMFRELPTSTAPPSLFSSESRKRDRNEKEGKERVLADTAVLDRNSRCASYDTRIRHHARAAGIDAAHLGDYFAHDEPKSLRHFDEPAEPGVDSRGGRGACGWTCAGRACGVYAAEEKAAPARRVNGRKGDLGSGGRATAAWNETRSRGRGTWIDTPGPWIFEARE